LRWFRLTKAKIEAAIKEGDIVVAALDRYQVKHGRYPKTLEDPIAPYRWLDIPPRQQWPNPMRPKIEVPNSKWPQLPAGELEHPQSRQVII
jgi:hypothetical protein